jgi:hypothetical protein
MGTITQAEAILVLRVLQHARDDEPRQRLRGVLGWRSSSGRQGDGLLPARRRTPAGSPIPR